MSSEYPSFPTAYTCKKNHRLQLTHFALSFVLAVLDLVVTKSLLCTSVKLVS